MNQAIWKRVFRTLRGATIALLLSIVFVASTHAAPVQQSADAGAVTSLDGVQNAVVRVTASGSFALPGSSEEIQDSRTGTAFIYNSLGYAYTNHHIVAGADSIQVRLVGEEEPRSANVIWRSACDDLAVIDIEGSGFSYLNWDEGELTAGTKVYAAGFPLGAYKPQLSQGAINGVSSDGDTPWASMDSIISHSADTYPGSSGGPLVTANGQVVGINFAGDLDSLQSVAIPREIVQAAQQRMISGSDYMELGIGGQAIVFEEDLSGILVMSVADGSLAERTGIQPADFLISLDGEPMATDGSMSAYCSIMKSHSNSDALTVSVFRPFTEQILAGTINGRALEPLFGTAPAVDTVAYTASANSDEPSAAQASENDTAANSAAAETVTSTVAIVGVNRLNIRQCAGMNCTVVGTALRDQCYTVDMKEQVADITWMRILDTDGAVIGWFAGAPYSRAAASCPAAAVEESATGEAATEQSTTEEASTEEAPTEEAAPEEPAAEEPASDESTAEETATEATDAQEPAAEEESNTEENIAEEPATEEPAAEQPSAEEPAAEEITEEPAAEEPAAEEPAAEEVSVPSTPAIPAANETCILFENFIGAEITITFTNQGNGWNRTFTLTNMEQRIECFEAGEYTYTLDAPPPWGSTSGSLKLKAGQHGTFPISGR